MTRAEIARNNNAIRFMGLHCPRQACLWWATTEKDSDRHFISSLQKKITWLQKEHDLYGYNVTVFETRSAIHAHIIFIGNSSIAQRLRESKFGSKIEVAPVTNESDLALKYLAKERTPQAGYRLTNLGGRLSGSHRLEGGGDRVRLSRELERDAIDAGVIRPWIHTNARRSSNRRTHRLKNSGPHARAPRPAGQLQLPIPEIARPVVRLRDFGGGIVPPSVAAEIEHRRRLSGMSQRELGRQIGRSQGQVANAIRGHDPISITAVNRIREVLL